MGEQPPRVGMKRVGSFLILALLLGLSSLESLPAAPAHAGLHEPASLWAQPWPAALCCAEELAQGPLCPLRLRPALPLSAKPTSGHSLPFLQTQGRTKIANPQAPSLSALKPPPHLPDWTLVGQKRLLLC